jgi:hypothetical protein
MDSNNHDANMPISHILGNKLMFNVELHKNRSEIEKSSERLEHTRCSYYENKDGEQWVAKWDDKQLIIAGLRTGWKGLIFDRNEAEIAGALVTTFLVKLYVQTGMHSLYEEEFNKTSDPNMKLHEPCLQGYKFDETESHWLISVLETFIQFQEDF